MHSEEIYTSDQASHDRHGHGSMLAQKELGEVLSLVQSQQLELDVLHDTITRLEVKLAPILRNEPDAEEPRAYTTAMTELGFTMQKHVASLSEARDRINSVIYKAEL